MNVRDKRRKEIYGKADRLRGRDRERETDTIMAVLISRNKPTNRKD